GPGPGYVYFEYEPDKADGYSHLGPATKTKSKLYMDDLNGDGVPDLVIWRKVVVSRTIEESEEIKKRNRKINNGEEENDSTKSSDEFLVMLCNEKKGVFEDPVKMVIKPPEGIRWLDLFPKSH